MVFLSMRPSYFISILQKDLMQRTEIPREKKASAIERRAPVYKRKNLIRFNGSICTTVGLVC